MTNINRNLRCIHGYTNYVAHIDLITWVPRDYWEMLFAEFSPADKYFSVPGQLSVIIVKR